MTRSKYLVVASAIAAGLLVPTTSQAQWENGTAGAIYYNGGRVGVGVTAPANQLHLLVPDGSLNVPFKMETNGPDSISGISIKNDARNWHIRVDGTDGDKFKIFEAVGGYRMTITTAGDVGIGTTNPSTKLDVAGNVNVTGDMNVTGNIAAKYQDVAEWVPSSESLAPGTVVVLDRERENEVIGSSTAYDAAVAGVISTRPGLVLGEAAPSKVQVATVGRVKVRVDATRAPIRIGDLLVTSEIPGTAMRSEPIEIGGATLHRPGTLIGKALEPLASGKGEILVLLSLQ
jgi:hypothetical protein